MTADPILTDSFDYDLRFFDYDHLPAPLNGVSKLFHDLANQLIDGDIHDLAEMAVALRKLLEAKDAAVRASLRLREITPPTEHLEDA